MLELESEAAAACSARESLAERLVNAERELAARSADAEAMRAEIATQRALFEQLRRESAAEKQIHSSHVCKRDCRLTASLVG